MIVSFSPPADLNEHLLRPELGLSVTDFHILRPTVAGIAHKPDQDPNHYIYMVVG